MTMVSLTCPFCGADYYLPASDNKWAVIECGEEEGGCGKLFIYQTDVIRTVLKRKVQGGKADGENK